MNVDATRPDSYSSVPLAAIHTLPAAVAADDYDEARLNALGREMRRARSTLRPLPVEHTPEGYRVLGRYALRRLQAARVLQWPDVEITVIPIPTPQARTEAALTADACDPAASVIEVA